MNDQSKSLLESASVDPDKAETVSHADAMPQAAQDGGLGTQAREGEQSVSMRCQTCNSPRSKSPCFKCGGGLVVPSDGWEEPKLPDAQDIRELARAVGYGIGVHGSFERDLDLIAAPWVEDAVSPRELAEHIAKFLPGRIAAEFEDAPHGRAGFNIKPDGWFRMIDLSVMTPHPAAPSADKLRIAVEALEPFANLGVTSGPDDEPCHYAYRITRGAIRKARQALAALKAEGA